MPVLRSPGGDRPAWNLVEDDAWLDVPACRKLPDPSNTTPEEADPPRRATAGTSRNVSGPRQLRADGAASGTSNVRWST
jgi:hypothetical protein